MDYRILLILVLSHSTAPATHSINYEQIFKQINLAPFAEWSNSDNGAASPLPAEAHKAAVRVPMVVSPLTVVAPPLVQRKTLVIVQG